MVIHRLANLRAVFVAMLLVPLSHAPAHAECTLSGVLKFATSDEQAIEMYNALCRGKAIDATVQQRREARKVVLASPEMPRAQPFEATPPNSSASPKAVTEGKPSGAGASPVDQINFFRGFSVGLAALRNKAAVVSDASVVNGTVRANSESSWHPELLLAKNFYFHHEPTKENPNGSCLWTSIRACPGVFIGIGFGGSSGSQVIDMVGGGVMLGFGSSIYDASKDQAHNIGLGIGRRFNVKVLGDGIHNNTALPTGETQVRYKTVDFTAPFLFYSYKFN